MRRIGFEATTTLTATTSAFRGRTSCPGGGVVVSNEIRLALDMEAILDEDLRRVGEDNAVYDPRELPPETRAGSPDVPGE